MNTLPPGLRGYVAAQQQGQQRQMQELQGLGALMGIQGQMQDRDLKQQMAPLQMEQARLAMEEIRRKAGERQSILGALSQDPRLQGNPTLMALAQSNPSAVLPYLMPKPKEQTIVPPGSTVLGPDNKPLFSAPFKPDKDPAPSNVARLLAEKAALPPDDPQHRIYDSAITHLTNPQSQRVTVNNPAPVTPVTIADPNDPSGTIIIDGRTKQLLGKGPKLTQSGAMDAKRQFGMQGIGAIINEAESLLTNKAKPPTQSGIGSLVDSAAGFVGITPAGAAEAQRLKSVGGALVAKMPRMEGPQSDKDVVLYKEMAGMVGDASIPIERRAAALDTVKLLWTKYERLNPDAFGGNAPASGGSLQDAARAELDRRRGMKK